MSEWIRVTNELPKPDENVWGFDCFYHTQGSCTICPWDAERLIWTDGNDDCLITHWGRVEMDPPSNREIKKVTRLLEKRNA